MKYALFPGCKSGFYLPRYKTSSSAVLSALGIELKELEFNCCGYPMRDKDLMSFLLLSIRNLAIAEEKGLPILTLCKCCFGALKHADHFFKNDPDKKKMITALLKEEGLSYGGTTQIRHILTVLDMEGETLKKQIKKPLKHLKIAPHYGCHALRPSNITQFDAPHAPHIFERIIRLTGAEPLEWSRRLECCGDPLHQKNRPMSHTILRQKMESARQAGADMICSACNYCQLQFDNPPGPAAQEELESPIPSILVSELLGLAMGMPGKNLEIPAPLRAVRGHGYSF
ncbi:CoB--CoM heterodisulfide reductase iron-sulfur subunit B family protein [Desulfospira joergensenii]|uniref:CoB--CoM heterodisulfide reductase iron-sulfur subunit B family protein n=1 Tax=Desulfospira joergensenii TaxID=53329 RepID=UPI0003B41FD7|nr:CoB--CoM heterodisulfide reductase iron-sulfur subunit B family protein [Desulfospira joergensenii]